MHKRGQITVFVILGVVILVSIILVAVFRGETVKQSIEKQLSGTTSFSENVEVVSQIVQACLDDSMKEAFKQLSVGNVNDYKLEFGNVVKSEVLLCVNFSLVPLTISPGVLEEVDVSYGAGNTKIRSVITYNVLIQDADNVERLNQFSSEISIIPNCCLEVEVDTDCRVERDVRIASCGLLYNLEVGESLKEGGVCRAC